MNRIRTIATAGIVAGSVAFAAALISSGGVGASFVDAAGAGASIQVADQFTDESGSCTITITANGKVVDLGAPFLLSQFSNGKNTVTVHAEFSAPSSDELITGWNIVPTGDLKVDTVPDGNGVVITFTWIKPRTGNPTTGSASVIFTCTTRAKNVGDGDNHPGGGTRGGDGWKSNGLTAMGLNNVNSIGANVDSKSSADSGDTSDSTTQTFSFQAVIDLPAEQSDPACETTSTATSVTDGSATEPSTDTVDAPDTEECPTTDGDLTTAPSSDTPTSSSNDTTTPTSSSTQSATTTSSSPASIPEATEPPVGDVTAPSSPEMTTASSGS